MNSITSAFFRHATVGASSGKRALARTGHVSMGMAKRHPYAIGGGAASLVAGGYMRGRRSSGGNGASSYPTGSRGRAYWDNWGKTGDVGSGPPPPYGSSGSNQWS